MKKEHRPDYSDVEKLPFYDIVTPPFDIEKHTILGVYSGSVAYGTNTANSDVDIRGVVIAPDSYYFGLCNFEHATNQTKDISYFGIKKFFDLAYKNNPHQIEMLFTLPEHRFKVTEIGQRLLHNRDMFLSKFVKGTFNGYAFQQLCQVFTKKTNGTGRQHLIQQFGYDTKMTMHAVRLFRMGIELCETGQLNVFRPDRDFLLEIRNGKYTLDELCIMERGDKGWELVGGLCFDLKQQFHRALETTNLPEKPNFQAVDNLLQELTRESLFHA